MGKQLHVYPDGAHTHLSPGSVILSSLMDRNSEVQGYKCTPLHLDSWDYILQYEYRKNEIMKNTQCTVRWFHGQIVVRMCVS